MQNYLDFTASCRLYGQKQSFRVYYIEYEGNQIPFPIDVCDVGHNCEDCFSCVSEVYSRAKGVNPQLFEVFPPSSQ